MTTSQAAYAEILALDRASSRRAGRARPGVGDDTQLTGSHLLQTGPATRADDPAGQRRIHLLADTRSTGPRGPHPGDVLYWVACLGGACLLLLCATT